MSSPPVTPTLPHRAAPAAHEPQRVFTTLAHRLAADLRHEAYRHTRQSRAAGIDGVTATMSAEPRADNRRDGPERLRRGRDQAAPVEPVGSEQDAGGQGPMGQPAFAAKIVQRAVAMRLAAIDAQEFQDGSDGLRPGRSPPAARQAVRERGRPEGLGWIVDADVRGYCDRIDRTRWREVRRQRVNAGSIWRLIGKWLRAGVVEHGGRPHPATGVVQGGVRSPGLAKVFLQQVLDAGFARDGRPRLKGRGCRMRLADDCCLGGERAADARKIMVKPKRLARLGLTMHPEQTALSAFGKPEARQASAHGDGTCEVLGLTHDWATSRRGFGVSKRRTAHQRLRRPKTLLWRGCRTTRHAPLQDQ